MKTVALFALVGLAALFCVVPTASAQIGLPFDGFRRGFQDDYRFGPGYGRGFDRFGPPPRRGCQVEPVYHVFYRRCHTAPWVCAGRFDCRFEARRKLFYLKRCGFHAYMKCFRH